MYKIKEIPNFPGYWADIDGNIWSSKKRVKSQKSNKGWININKPIKKLTYVMNTSGYLQVGLHKKGKFIVERIHRLILETFVGTCPQDMECCHGNGIRTDNRLENLRWGTRADNIRDAINHGNHYCLKQKGEAHHNVKLNEFQIRVIRRYPKNYGTGKYLAKCFDVHLSTISNITLKKTWSHIS
ncbi:MAG: HNH endonuclease signature motif containing protein [bacterium]